MADYQQRNLRVALRNGNENWMAEKLRTTGLGWTRQVRWGFRIFDFWCNERGVAVEVDGVEHSQAWDAKRDDQDYRISGILVFRVRNRNEEDAAQVLALIAAQGSWNLRRLDLGLSSLGHPHADRFVFEGPRRPPQVQNPPRPRAPKRPPQAVCGTCHQRVRKRRPDGAIRCRCPRSAPAP